MFELFNKHQVYGESSFELVEELIKVINFNSADNFIDLGSGWLSLVFLMTNY